MIKKLLDRIRVAGIKPEPILPPPDQTKWHPVFYKMLQAHIMETTIRR